MSRQRLTVVLSQAQGKNPVKRALEESIVAALLMESGLDVSVIPHLYDLGPDHTGRLFLESISGDMVFLSWLFPRAAFWVLDRDGIKGRWGETQLKPPVDEDDLDEEEAAVPAPPKGIGALDVPDRFIYCLDLRDFSHHEPYLEEIRRLAAESRARNETKAPANAPTPAVVQLGMAMLNGTPQPTLGAALQPEPGNGVAAPTAQFAPDQLLEQPNRRWYPV